MGFRLGLGWRGWVGDFPSEARGWNPDPGFASVSERMDPDPGTVVPSEARRGNVRQPDPSCSASEGYNADFHTTNALGHDTFI